MTEEETMTDQEETMTHSHRRSGRAVHVWR
jgi:hypothetical protein